MGKRWLFWIVFIGCLVLDQWVKWYARAHFPERGSATLIPNVLDFTLTYNKGIAFGLLQGAGVLLAPVAVAIAIGAALYSYRNPDESRLTHLAMALLASGALGNLYDRLVHGKVTDMFWIRMFDFPVFNIADACITVAAAILILKWAREAFQSAPTAAASEE
ncbi:MAG TPA: signal peptidase II [Fimbriimonadaceae bacterium]|nr:signal peptidase II [Fimbriimonadaceae bacterium]